MKKLIVSLLSIFTLVGCASFHGYENSLDHGVMPDVKNDETLERISSAIKATLKDPDSLKNLSVTTPRKCYAVDYFLKYVENSASWCAFASYQAKNSYGGYVRGSDLIYKAKEYDGYLTGHENNRGKIEFVD